MLLPLGIAFRRYFEVEGHLSISCKRETDAKDVCFTLVQKEKNTGTDILGGLLKRSICSIHQGHLKTSILQQASQQMH
jgi:hypothetical protein